jgi:hypothetical protein
MSDRFSVAEWESRQILNLQGNPRHLPFSRDPSPSLLICHVRLTDQGHFFFIASGRIFMLYSEHTPLCPS